jgi:hypothetical protein
MADTLAVTESASRLAPPPIRPPLSQRVGAVAFGGVWCVVLLSAFVVVIQHGSAVALMLLGMFVAGSVMIYRYCRLAVEIRPDHLVIRNWLRTRRVARDEIEGFREGPKLSFGNASTVFALLKDGRTLSLDGAEHPMFLTSSYGRTQVEAHLQTLRTWLRVPE